MAGVGSALSSSWSVVRQGPGDYCGIMGLQGMSGDLGTNGSRDWIPGGGESGDWEKVQVWRFAGGLGCSRICMESDWYLQWETAGTLGTSCGGVSRVSRQAGSEGRLGTGCCLSSVGSRYKGAEGSRGCWQVAFPCLLNCTAPGLCKRAVQRGSEFTAPQMSGRGLAISWMAALDCIPSHKVCP